MKAVFLRASLLLLSCSLAGCATGGGEAREQGGTDVTRVHLGQPVARGQIAIEAYDAADANLPEFRSYAGSVQRQLARLGWTVVSTLGQSEQIALVDVEQGSRAALEARGMRIGAGAAGGSAGASGAMATMLEVRIKRRSDGSVVWEGRAISDDGGDRIASVEKLADALFRDFPGDSGRTIRTR
ncbi:MAG TPA: DUF4136 domain-containing protein [Allosphingosinicella sp.]|nr:DUF4136 domain-containing protein [Allosphingosinicella sp.]